MIALTGGIASGKSTVAKVWERLGGQHIDADELAREVVAQGTVGLSQAVARFGEEILDAEGNLDRTKLGQIVFSDPAARRDLEGILHPLIRQLAQEKIQALAGKNVFYTIPLLVETKSPLAFDKVVTVSAPKEVRVRRLVENRGLSETAALQRISAQATDSEREEIADFVIDSDCRLEELEARAKEVWASLTKESVQ